MKLQNGFILCCLIFGLLCPVSAKQLSNEKIVFASNRDGNWEIYMMNPDGTRQERLTYDRAVDCEPVISPTGNRILFTSNRGGTRDLYLMDVDGRNIRSLFGVSEAYRTEPAWSPDGKRIVYSQRAFGATNIHTARVDGTFIKLVAQLKSAHSGYPSWSSDGTEMAFVVADEIHWASRQIRFINLESNKQETLFPDDFPRMFQPAYSPVDDKIAFVWFRPAEKQQSLFIVNRDGSYLRRIESLVANTPVWAPFGNELIYAEGVIGSNSQIFKVNLISQKVTQLTDDGSNYPGNWFAPKQLPVSPSTSLLSTSWSNVKSQTK
ncbi:PD40 domain-containing protein [Candidatus Poribacteria bacterium]|nr:PD40 domain-containing protein [Candidatus Poribacteria bacterium]